MELIVDTNVAVSAILRAEITRNLMFNSELRLFSPDFLKTELEKHAEEFVSKSGLERNEYEFAVAIIISNILQIPKEQYAKFESEAIFVIFRRTRKHSKLEKIKKIN